MAQTGTPILTFVSSTIGELVAELDVVGNWIIQRFRELFREHNPRSEAVDTRFFRGS